MWTNSYSLNILVKTFYVGLTFEPTNIHRSEMWRPQSFIGKCLKLLYTSPFFKKTFIFKTWVKYFDLTPFLTNKFDINSRFHVNRLVIDNKKLISRLRTFFSSFQSQNYFNCLILKILAPYLWRVFARGWKIEWRKREKKNYQLNRIFRFAPFRSNFIVEKYWIWSKNS